MAVVARNPRAWNAALIAVFLGESATINHTYLWLTGALHFFISVVVFSRQEAALAGGASGYRAPGIGHAPSHCIAHLGSSSLFPYQALTSSTYFPLNLPHVFLLRCSPSSCDSQFTAIRAYLVMVNDFLDSKLLHPNLEPNIHSGPARLLLDTSTSDTATSAVSMAVQ
jgi:hypothetical protein